MWYRLQGRTIVPIGNTPDELYDTWARVAETYVKQVHISTVFLGLDHSYGGGPPVTFETMVFGGKLNEAQVRYCTYDEAERGHQRMVRRVRRAEQGELERAIAKVRRRKN